MILTCPKKSKHFGRLTVCSSMGLPEQYQRASHAPTKKWTQIQKVPFFRKSLLMNPESYWGLHLFLQSSSFSIWNGYGIWPLTTGRSPRMDTKVWTINVKSDSALIPALGVSGFLHFCIHWNLVARSFTVGLWSVQGSETFTKNVTF